MKIFIAIFCGLWGVNILYTLTKIMIWRSNSKIYRWLRRLYWLSVIDKLRDEHITNWKVKSYLIKYLRESIAAKQYYIKYGYDEFKAVIIGKVEELERFVEEYRYNTFNNLSKSENDFIDQYEKRRKKL